MSNLNFEDQVNYARGFRNMGGYSVPNNTGAALTGGATAISGNVSTFAIVTTAPSVAPSPAPPAGCKLIVYCAADDKLYAWVSGTTWIKSAALA